MPSNNLKLPRNLTVLLRQVKSKYKTNKNSGLSELSGLPKLSKLSPAMKYKKNKNKNYNDSGINNTNTYINELISKYYDNDKLVTKYLKTGYKKQHIFPEARRIIAIGDIHGDFEIAVRCLTAAKCINYIEPPVHKTVSSMDAFFKSLEWIGGDTYIVQLGDQIDRIRPQSWNDNNITNETAFEDEGSTLEIFYLFHYLDQLARKHNGRVFSIIGNHEIMNIDGDFRYVSNAEFRCFKEHIGHVYHRNSKYPYNSRSLKNNQSRLYPINKTIKRLQLTPIGFRERLYAFSPTGLCANFIGDNYYTMLHIGQWLFCHGGPTMSSCGKYPIDLLNNVVSMYLLGIDSQDEKIEAHFNRLMHEQPNIADSGAAKSSDDVIDNECNECLIWNREFGEAGNDKLPEKQAELEAKLDSILAKYNTLNTIKDNNLMARYIAIGHTPQFRSGINSICNNRIWRCDVAMSRAFDKSYNKPFPQILEIINNKPKIIKI